MAASGFTSKVCIVSSDWKSGIVRRVRRQSACPNVRVCQLPTTFTALHGVSHSDLRLVGAVELRIPRFEWI